MVAITQYWLGCKAQKSPCNGPVFHKDRHLPGIVGNQVKDGGERAIGRQAEGDGHHAPADEEGDRGGGIIEKRGADEDVCRPR